VAQLSPIGVVPFPKLLMGKQERGRFPDSYTEEERALFRRHSLAAERANPDLFGAGLPRWGLPGRGGRERPSIDPTVGRKYLDKAPNHRGRLCSAGQEFVRIGPTGNVDRCGGGKSLGNLLEGTVRLKAKPKPCDRRHCLYFCEKFTARAEAQWARKHPLAAMARRVKRAVLEAAQ
jgi:hypothetical protein